MAREDRDESEVGIDAAVIALAKREVTRRGSLKCILVVWFLDRLVRVKKQVLVLVPSASFIVHSVSIEIGCDFILRYIWRNLKRKS